MTYPEYRASRKRLANQLREQGLSSVTRYYVIYPYTPGNEMLWKAQLESMSDYLETLKRENRKGGITDANG